MSAEGLILIGASVRAAAWSAWQAGFRDVIGIDLFADADLAAYCKPRRIREGDYPLGFVEAVAACPNVPVIYTGGLENYPRLIDELTRIRPVWGNDAQTLRRIRDPFQMAQALCDAGWPTLRTLPDVPATFEAGRWLSKPRRGAGGAGIRHWQGETLDKTRYFQEHRTGPAYAAIYCAHSEHQVRRLGLTRQLVGEAWTGAKPFQYCGSVGPCADVPDARLHDLGFLLARRFGLRGLFGVDLILDGDIYPVEVNPRYSASIEVIERATGELSLAWHRTAFDRVFVPASTPANPTTECWSKAILFARRDLVFPRAGPWANSVKAAPESEYGDIPHAGTPIKQGQPIFTLFAKGDGPEHCLHRLREKVTHSETWLYP